MNNKKGVSMISLVITIIVIIVLASIVFNSSNSIEEASQAKAMQELTEVKKGVLNARTVNAKEGIDEKTLNKGFIKVKIENPPENFMSYDDDESTGYLVDLSAIDYAKSKSGQSYVDISSGDTVKFYDTDVYVYDAALKVFYVKSGRYFDGYDTDSNNTVQRKDGPTITIISNVNGRLEIEVDPIYGGDITSVLVDGAKATPIGGNRYTFVVDDKSKEKVTIIASEDDGGTTTKVVPIEAGGNESDINTPDIISYDCVYNQGNADVSVIAEDKNARLLAYAVTTGANANPDGQWVDITEPANRYTIKFNVTENGIYTVWVRNSFGKVASKSKSIRVILDVKYKYDANGGESIDISDTTRHIGCNTFVDLTPKASRKHYEFLGWNTKITATGGMTVYNIGTENDLVLYPIFRPKIKLAKPAITVPTYTYNGKLQTLQLSNFDETLLEISENTMIDAGTKTAVVSILNKDRYEWTDGTDDDLYFEWTIDKKKITTVWGDQRLFTYNGQEQAPTATVSSGVDGETVNLKRTTAVNTGSYTSTASMVSVTGGQGKVENYILQNTTVDFRIQNADMSGSITITGNNVFQQTLTANTSEIVPTGCSLRYQWYSATYSTTSGGTVISGATLSTYTVPKNMIGRYIYVVVTASKANYNSKTFSDVTDASNNKYAAVVCEHTYADATCTVPKTCTKCGATTGSALGHNWSGATCTTDNTCTRCGAWGSGALGHDKRSATCTEPEKCVRCGTTWGSKLGHNYSSATCTTPKKCSRCGATSGSALGHNYSTATCTSPSTCSRCGTTTGSALGHNWSAATCTTGSSCTRCGAQGSGALGHDTRDATCTEPERCVRCGTTWGSKLGHNYRSATCTSPKKCRRCGATSGSALGHNYSKATCTSSSTCSRCGATNGSALGHQGGGRGALVSSATCTKAAQYRNICIRCGNTLGGPTVSYGSALGHNYSSATCTSPKKCSRCGATSGSALGHNWKKSGKKYKCSRCGRTVASM